MLNDFISRLKTGGVPVGKPVTKLGTVAVGTVETTPVVWNGKLLRFEWVRNSGWGETLTAPRKTGCYRFVDMETGRSSPEFAQGHAFGCCFCENGRMYVHGVRGNGGGNLLDTFVSDDLANWEFKSTLTLPESIELYNTSVCRGPDGYVMTLEFGGGDPIVGKPFTIFFATSGDLLDWKLLPPDKYAYSRDRYTACPSIRFSNGYYYIIYLESLPCHRWAPYIIRSRDLESFELGVRNPVLFFGDEDKKIYPGTKFSPAELEYIRNSVNCNNSDVDLCEFKGKTEITYSWGNQLGREFLARARFDGGIDEFLRSFF